MILSQILTNGGCFHKMIRVIVSRSNGDYFSELCHPQVERDGTWNRRLKKELDWFYDISSWDGYRDYLGSQHTVEVPIKKLTKPHRHGRIFE